MPTSYQSYSPEQDLLLPQSLQEWLPAGHLAHYVSDTIDALDLSAFFKRYEDGGSRNQPFHPAMMVKVLVYGYATGVFSSRKIARKLHEDVAFRVLAAGNFPKHRTLCDFRALVVNLGVARDKLGGAAAQLDLRLSPLRLRGGGAALDEGDVKGVLGAQRVAVGARLSGGEWGGKGGAALREAMGAAGDGGDRKQKRQRRRKGADRQVDRRFDLGA